MGVPRVTAKENARTTAVQWAERAASSHGSRKSGAPEGGLKRNEQNSETEEPQRLNHGPSEWPIQHLVAKIGPWVCLGLGSGSETFSR